MHRTVALGRLTPHLYFIVFKMGNPMERVACLCLHVQPRERDSAFTLHSGCAAQPAPALFPLPSPPRAFQLSASALISSPPGLAAYCSHLSAGLTACLQLGQPPGVVGALRRFAKVLAGQHAQVSAPAKRLLRQQTQKQACCAPTAMAIARTRSPRSEWSSSPAGTDSGTAGGMDSML